MGNTCCSSGWAEAPRKSQTRFPAGIDSVLLDSDLQRSRRKSTQNGLSASRFPLVKDAKDVRSYRAQPTAWKTMERKPPSMDKNPWPAPSSLKSFDGKVSVPSIRKPVDGRLPSTTSTRKTLDKRTDSTVSTRKSLFTNKPEDPKLAEVLGLRTGRKDLVDSIKTEGSGWQPLEHLLKERPRKSDSDDRTKMSRYSPARRPAVLSPARVHGDDRPRNRSSRVSPSRTVVQDGRQSVDRKREARNPMERKSEERKPVEWKSKDGNVMETKTIDRSQSMERIRAAERKVVERRSVDRISGNRKLVETVKSATPERKSFDRNSVDTTRKERIRAPAENSGAPLTFNENRRSLDSITHVSQDHNSKTVRKPRARNGYFTPDTSNPKMLSNARHRRPGSDPRFRTSFTDKDFLRQKFLIDNAERAIQARLDSSLSDGRPAGQSDHADPSYSSNDYRSAHQIDEFTKSCRESAARAAARDLDAFKNLTSIDSSDSSGVMLRSY